MVLIGLGSNIGDRGEFLRRAIELLGNTISDIKTSSIHETPALLPPDAPPEWDIAFLNMVISGNCDIAADALLAAAKTIEQELGRQYRGFWGPREIDVDILDYGNAVINTPKLTLPHLQMHKRAFVMKPLAEIAPEWQHPLLNKTATELAAAL